MTPDEQKTLENRVKVLEDLLLGLNKSPQFNEKIRDIVIFDRDSKTTRTTTIGSVPADVTKTPDIYLRVYFRGKAYNIGAYNLT